MGPWCQPASHSQRLRMSRPLILRMRIGGKKVLYIVSLCRKYTRALTFENGAEVSGVHKEVSAVHKNVSGLLAQAHILKSPKVLCIVTSQLVFSLVCTN